MLFSEKKDQVKRAVLRDQRGQEFDEAVKHYINRSRRLIAKEGQWSALRCVLEPAFSTSEELTTGTATFTNASKTVTFSGVSLITQGIEPGQRIKATGSGDSGTVFDVSSVDSESQITLNKNYDGDTSSGTTYQILGKERYSLPVYMNQMAFVWHEAFGYSYILDRIDERDVFFQGFDRETIDTPDAYYLPDPFGVERQPSAASAVSIVSSSNDSNDQSAAGVRVVVFGIVSSVPDREVLTLNGTTRVDGSKSFSSIHRVVKTKTTAGRITLSDQLPSAGTGSTLATLPAGVSYSEPMYKRIGLLPMPNDVIPINIWGYRAPMTLTNDDDISEFGTDFDQAEILLASAIGNWEERQLDEGNSLFKAYRYEISRLKHHNVDRIDFLNVLKSKGNKSFGTRNTAFIHSRLSFRQLGSRFGPMSAL